MSYELVTSERSPFGRAVRLFMTANEIPFTVRFMNFVDDAKAREQLKSETPINKVPFLVIDRGSESEKKLFDSRVIINWLTEKHGLKKLTLEEENILSAIYSCMDTCVSLFLLKIDGFDISADKGYIARQRERLPSNYEFILPWARETRDWDYPAMALYSYLEWAEKRAKLLQTNDVFEDFRARFKNEPGVQETAIT